MKDFITPEYLRGYAAQARLRTISPDAVGDVLTAAAARIEELEREIAVRNRALITACGFLRENEFGTVEAAKATAQEYIEEAREEEAAIDRIIGEGH